MRSYFILIILLLFFTLSSCSYISGRLLVSLGNYSYERGNYIEAISFYNRSLSYEEVLPWSFYNLGLTYAALGENESALEMWERAEEVSVGSFLFYIYYNEGVLFFYQGLYTQAFESFKKALKISPFDREAKINLELSLDKIRTQSRVDEKIIPTSSELLSDEEQEIFNFIINQESSPWMAKKEISPPSYEPDY